MEDIEQVATSIGKLSDEIYELEGKVPDSDISKMMRELTDLNSLYTRLRRKRPKRKRRRMRYYSIG